MAGCDLQNTSCRSLISTQAKIARSAVKRVPATPRCGASSVPARKIDDWPGNIRELENLLLEAFLLTQTTTIQPENINIPSAYNNECFENLSLQEAKRNVVEQFERDDVINLLIQHQGNLSYAAKATQKDRSDFGKLIRKHRIDVRTFRNKDL